MPCAVCLTPVLVLLLVWPVCVSVCLCSAQNVLSQVLPQLQGLVGQLPPTFFQPLVSLQGLQVRLQCQHHQGRLGCTRSPADTQQCADGPQDCCGP